MALGVCGKTAEVAVRTDVEYGWDTIAVGRHAEPRRGRREGRKGEAPRVGGDEAVGGVGGRGHVGDDARGRVVLLELGYDLRGHAVWRLVSSETHFFSLSPFFFSVFGILKIVSE